MKINSILQRVRRGVGVAGLILATVLGGSLGAAELNPEAALDSFYQPRPNVNPALIYWKAFAFLPELTEEQDRIVSDRRHASVDAATSELVRRYDVSFKLLRRARISQSPCDWGVDLSEGPEALLPQLAKAKRLAQAAAYRANYFLAKGEESEAVTDLLAAFALARQVSTDRVLISALVQIAMENILLSTVAESFYRFSNDGLAQLQAGLAQSPARGGVGRTVDTERYGFIDWYHRQIEEVERRHPAGSPQAHAEVMQMLRRSMGEEGDTNFVDNVMRSAGGTVAGLKEHLRQVNETYGRMRAIFALPFHELRYRLEIFQKEVADGDLALAKALLPAIIKSQEKEFGVVAKLAMFNAAVALRLGGAEAFNLVPDPFGDGPLNYEVFRLEGVDRGFRLTSALHYRGFAETLIFLESAGPEVYVDGPKAGQAIPPDPAK